MIGQNFKFGCKFASNLKVYTNHLAKFDAKSFEYTQNNYLSVHNSRMATFSSSKFDGSDESDIEDLRSLSKSIDSSLHNEDKTSSNTLKDKKKKPMMGRLMKKKRSQEYSDESESDIEEETERKSKDFQKSEDASKSRSKNSKFEIPTMAEMPQIDDKYGPIELDQSLNYQQSSGYESHWSSKNYQGHTEEDALKTSDIIPPGIQLRHLVWPQTKSSIFLVGVNREDSLHATFVHEALSRSNTDFISIQIAPDEPYFIRANHNYLVAWRQFVEGLHGIKFLINPNPSYLSDVILNPQKIKLLMNNILGCPDVFEVGARMIYHNKGDVDMPMQVDALLTPLIYAYNNADKNFSLMVNDTPKLLEREYLVKTLRKDEIDTLLQEYLLYLREGEFENSFDPRLLHPEAFIHPKANYLTETLRQACHSSKKIFAVVESDYVDLIEDEWKKLDKGLRDLREVQMIRDRPLQSMDYTQYIEKHCKLDIISDKFVKNYFVDLKSFPFSGKGIFGANITKANFFTIWDHFYRKALKKKPGEITQTRMENFKESKFEIEDEEEFEKAFKSHFTPNKNI